jgi:hypothetical protein
MPEYRLYCQDRDGGFTKKHDFSANDDDDALAKAKGLKVAVKSELWEGNRLVAELPGHFS